MVTAAFETDEEGRPNRIVRSINKKEVDIQNRIDTGITTPEGIEEARKGLDMRTDEYCRFQELKTLAVATGVITVAEGMTIYHYMGSGSIDTFNQQSAAVKFILTGFFKELLEKGLA